MNFSNIISVIIFLVFFIFFNLFITFINTRIVMKKSRTAKLQEIGNQKGYNFTKQWDCNYYTIAIDENKKAICKLIVRGMGFDVDKIIQNKIISCETYTSSFIPFMTREAGVKLKLENGEEYNLETLSLKKIITGTFDFNPIVGNAKKVAEEIKSVISSF
ncbi:hypothetical protein [Fusobacterium sp. PH5-44]|uniref:hypothetical protein n=1 Tax=unclassified Fusobacterium TaxID=2648384 RepID=UPI003D246F8A